MRLLDLFERKFNSIVDYAYAYPVIYDSKLEFKGLRKCYADNHLIIYHINAVLEKIHNIDSELKHYSEQLLDKEIFIPIQELYHK